MNVSSLPLHLSLSLLVLLPVSLDFCAQDVSLLVLGTLLFVCESLVLVSSALTLVEPFTSTLSLLLSLSFPFLLLVLATSFPALSGDCCLTGPPSSFSVVVVLVLVSSMESFLSTEIEVPTTLEVTAAAPPPP